MIDLNLRELRVIERLLRNRLNADFDLEIDSILRKIRKEINETEHAINGFTEWRDLKDGRNYS